MMLKRRHLGNRHSATLLKAVRGLLHLAEPPCAGCAASCVAGAPEGEKFVSLLTCDATQWSSFGVVFGSGDGEGVDDDVVFGQENHR